MQNDYVVYGIYPTNKTIDYGQDTDTNAAITGMLAGAYYGYDSIPKHLIEQIKDLEMIEDIYCKLIEYRDKINGESL